MAVKRAKTLTPAQYKKVVDVVRRTEHALRDEVALRLSFYAGLRAKEIAGLRWANNILDATGAVRGEVHITSDVGKRAVERVVPLDGETVKLLRRLRRARPEAEYVFYALHNNQRRTVPVKSESGEVLQSADTDQVIRTVDKNFVEGSVSANAVVQFFRRLYATAGMNGATSHSGRRTFITSRAQVANNHGCSLRDVQMMAGHKSLETTAAYIEPSKAQRSLVEAWA
ncbi:integrase [Brevundimonas phage vB_BpoS-Gurke]|uniref:Integrase n=1 Tax=Brevundimonas phage vB_BpoS-Gurke TaxID=2948599 RepID=A0A9E7SST2_9CAUD|nr:integrase [Brevundimonas phage vB_BpoS-Gurke]